MKPRLFLMFLSLLIGMHAQADDEWWANINLRSKHFSTSERFNENNLGMGIEYVRDSTQSMSAGFYHNSDYRYSRYLNFAYTPEEWHGFRAGVMAGLVDGYRHANDGGPILVGGFLVKTEWKKIGANANLYLIPACSECETPAVIALQLRFRFR